MKRKQAESHSSVITSSEESSVDYKLIAKKYYKLHEKYNLPMNNWNDLRALIIKYKKRTKKAICEGKKETQ